MKLEVGMYVRTECGIAKIIDIICGEDLVFDNDNIFDEHEKEIYKYNRPSMYGNWANSDIIKASHNIIDLIEEGDYVNGFPVIHKENDILKCGLLVQFKEDEIKSIVTKEMYSSVEYRVEAN